MLENLLRNSIDEPILTQSGGHREKNNTCSKTKTGKNALPLNKFDF